MLTKITTLKISFVRSLFVFEGQTLFHFLYFRWAFVILFLNFLVIAVVTLFIEILVRVQIPKDLSYRFASTTIVLINLSNHFSMPTPRAILRFTN